MPTSKTRELQTRQQQPSTSSNGQQQMNALAGRIRTCAEMAGSGDELARITGIPRRTLEYYLSGEHEPKVSRCLQIAAAVGVNAGWLVSGLGPMHVEGSEAPCCRRQQLPLLDMGHPCPPPGKLPDSSHLWVAISCLSLIGLQSHNLCAIIMRGDSMAPTIHPGDLLLIDQDNQRLIDGQLFALADGDTLLVKRLQHQLGGGVRIISDNPHYPEIETSASALNILGQVIWKGGLL